MFVRVINTPTGRTETKWNKQSRNSCVLGTLDPVWDWPMGGTYTFFVTPAQMKVTNLIITLYDRDPDNKDDFMGEVVIRLNDILPRITQGATQNTYQLKLQVSFLVT